MLFFDRPRPTFSELASYRRAADRGAAMFGYEARSPGAPWGSAGARGCADSGECGGLMRPLRWLAWWPGLASAESDEAGSSVERKVRCEPAVAGRLSGSGHGHRRKATAGAGHAPGQLGQSSSAAMSRSCSSRGWSCGSCWIEGSRFPRRRRWGRSALCTCAGIASSAPPLSRRVRTPHGIWIYLNGHEWAKRPPREPRHLLRGVDNWFRSVEDADKR